jgi:hypothetical protein
LARQVQLFGRASPETQVGRLPSIRHTDDIEGWLPSPNEKLLAKQGSEFAGLNFPYNTASQLDDAAGFLIPIARQKVTQQSIPKQFGFADVDQAS